QLARRLRHHHVREGSPDIERQPLLRHHCPLCRGGVLLRARYWDTCTGPASLPASSIGLCAMVRPGRKAMKITDVRVHMLEAKLSQPFSYSRAWYATRTALIVEIATDQGLTGWGECYGPAQINAAVVEAMRPLLIGQDPMRSEWLWQEIYARFRDHGQ